jgi:hypothetical protein
LVFKGLFYSRGAIYAFNAQYAFRTIFRKLTMSAPHSSVVVGHGDEIVDRGPVVAVDDVGRHVQVLRREVDEGVQLVAPVAVVAEPLQADDQNGGKGPQVELLGGLLVLLALRTVPEIGRR